MKTYFTKALLSITSAIVLLATPVVNAKLNASPESSTLEAQINQNINDMLDYSESPVSKSAIVKKINTAALELQTNELVRSNNDQLPKLKFKIVIAD